MFYFRWQQGPLTKLPDYTQTIDLSAIKAKGIQGVIITYPLDPYKGLLKDSTEIRYFLDRAKSADINVIVELQPTTSKTWFELSESKNDNYSDYYIWAKGKDEKTPPNNWVNILFFCKNEPNITSNSSSVQTTSRLGSTLRHVENTTTLVTANLISTFAIKRSSMSSPMS